MNCGGDILTYTWATTLFLPKKCICNFGHRSGHSLVKNELEQNEE